MSHRPNILPTTTGPHLRVVLGGVMRDLRKQRRLTLRAVSVESRVSLGYLSEVERGIKEVSSELISVIAQALGVPQSVMFREVAYRMSITEQLSASAPSLQTAATVDVHTGAEL